VIARDSAMDETPLPGALTIWLAPIGRPLHSATVDERPRALVKQPGPFTIPAVMRNECWLNVKVPAGAYIKSAFHWRRRRASQSYICGCRGTGGGGRPRRAGTIHPGSRR
jgi:hypothetical protein